MRKHMAFYSLNSTLVIPTKNWSYKNWPNVMAKADKMIDALVNNKNPNNSVRSCSTRPARDGVVPVKRRTGFAGTRSMRRSREHWSGEDICVMVRSFLKAAGVMGMGLATLCRHIAPRPGSRM